MITNGKHVDPNDYFVYSGRGEFSCIIRGCPARVKVDGKGKHLKNRHSDLFKADHTPENATYRTPMIRSIPRKALVEAFNKIPGRTKDLEVPA